MSSMRARLSYAATVSYRLSPTLIYAKTGTGYRAGGVNNGAIVAAAPNPLQPTYDNENTTSYEVGPEDQSDAQRLPARVGL
jgi:iron complex outermembrane receptor protein